VVPLEIPYIDLPEKQPAWVKRAMPARDFRLPPDVAILPEVSLVLPPEQGHLALSMN
jgi:hypothetical protein